MAVKKKAAPKKASAGKHGEVSFKYRSGGGSGEIVGTVPGKGTKKDPVEKIRPGKSSRHPGEPAFIHRRASKVR